MRGKEWEGRRGRWVGSNLTFLVNIATDLKKGMFMFCKHLLLFYLNWCHFMGRTVILIFIKIFIIILILLIPLLVQ